MRYFGGKARICKPISEVINNTLSARVKSSFVSPFLGGAWVESLVNADSKVLCDNHYYLIQMYKALQHGWIPPSTLSREEYDYIKAHQDETPHLTGFVGFGCSFSGKWFGGYAKDSTDRNYCLNAKNSVLQKMKTLEDSTFIHADYRKLNFTNAVVYCDPPYKGTTQYAKNEVGEFDSEEFWGVVRRWSTSNIVYVSEYAAPDDFTEVWSQNVKLDIRDAENKKKERVEKLFRYQ